MILNAIVAKLKRRSKDDFKADVPNEGLGWRVRLPGFLSHLRSLAATMRQKSSLVRQAQSVSKTLMADNRIL